MGTLTVDIPQRMAKMRAHTATHLLHRVLQDYFPTTRQAGSLVDGDYLRFDFTADRALTDDELTDIQSTINTMIAAAHDVSIQSMSYDDAVARGAKAFFEDKYGDTVRVVEIDGIASIELCGGTHVANTAHIGAFVIDKHEAVASGTKRLIARTGPGVVDHLRELHTTLQPLYTTHNTTQPTQLVERTTKQTKELSDLHAAHTSLQASMLTAQLDTLQPSADGPADLMIDLGSFAPLGIKDLVGALKSRPHSAIIYAASGQFAIIGSDDLDAKAWAQSHNLRGGGNASLFQGKDPAILAHIPTPGE